MRRILIPFLTCCATVLVSAQQKPAAPASAPVQMLTVDGIMRGPKLIGSSPAGVRWSKDSSKIYFTWQKAGEERSATWMVNKDGTGLRVLTPEEVRGLDAPATGRFDRAHKRTIAAEGGDIVITEVATGNKRVLMRTSDVESNPRWVRNDTAVTFMRDGNLYLMSLDGNGETAFAQLTDIVEPAADQQLAANGGGAGRAGAGGAGRGSPGGELRAGPPGGADRSGRGAAQLGAGCGRAVAGYRFLRPVACRPQPEA